MGAKYSATRDKLRNFGGNYRAGNKTQATLDKLMATGYDFLSSGDELQTTREELQATGDDLQANGDEIQATWEGLQATGDKLQS